MANNQPINGYIALFQGKRLELRATSLYAAKQKAIEHFKPSRKNEGLLSVTLAERADGSQVVHSTTGIPL